MFVIYSLEGEKVKLYDTCNTRKCVTELMRTCAINFIRRENGDAKAEDAFKDGVSDKEITEDRYFLRHSVEIVDRINVFKRTTTVVPGAIYGKSAVVKYEKVMIFGVTESDTEIIPEPIFSPTVIKSVAQEQQWSIIEEELKKRFKNTRDE